jgi:hypothetical protein
MLPFGVCDQIATSSNIYDVYDVKYIQAWLGNHLVNFISLTR